MIVRNNLLVLFTLLLSSSLWTQNKDIDSLKYELQNHLPNDTIKVNLLQKLAQLSYQENVEEALEYIDNSQEIAESLDYKKGKAKSLYLKGQTAQKLSNYQQAVNYYSQALEIYQNLNALEEIFDCYKAIGYAQHYNAEFNKSIASLKKSVEIGNQINIEKETAIPLKFIGYDYLDMGNYDQARVYYDQALAINEKYDNKIEISSCNLNIGSIYLKQARYTTALEYYNKSLKISEEIKDTIGISKVLNNIGIIYKNNDDLDKALDYYNRSLAIQKKIGTKRNVAVGLSNLGSIYIRKEEYTKALAHYKEALQIGKEINDKDSQSRYLINIGKLHMRLEEFDKSIEMFNEAKKINIKLGDQLGLCYSHLSIAESYFIQKKYNQALVSAKASNKIANKLGSISFQRDSYDLLAKLYEIKGNYKKALENNRFANSYNDSLFNKQNIEKIAKLEAEYKYQKALDSASIRELKLTKTVTATNRDLEKSKRNYLLAIIGILSMSIIIGGLIFYLKYKTIKSETQKIVIEQKLLRSQMTPHFIFNSLSVLQGMILNKEEKKSVSYLSKFSKLLRIILENSRDKMVLLSQELAAVENYLALQNLEYNGYNYNISVEENLAVNKFNIPPMLIQPFVENAIEHAFGNIKTEKNIDVAIKFVNHQLICTIIDNGIGIDTIKQGLNKNKSSLATKITSERLKILAKDLKMKGSLTIEDRKKYNEAGTIVTLIIPYQINEVNS